MMMKSRKEEILVCKYLNKLTTVPWKHQLDKPKRAGTISFWSVDRTKFSNCFKITFAL